MRAETASIPANTAQSIASNDLRVETSSPLSSMVVGKFFSVFFLSFSPICFPAAKQSYTRAKASLCLASFSKYGSFLTSGSRRGVRRLNGPARTDRLNNWRFHRYRSHSASSESPLFTSSSLPLPRPRARARLLARTYH